MDKFPYGGSTCHTCSKWIEPSLNKFYHEHKLCPRCYDMFMAEVQRDEGRRSSDDLSTREVNIYGQEVARDQEAVN
jgi:ribosomal protein S27AE